MTPPLRKKKPAFEIGVNLRVTQCFDKGGRNYMEDFSKYYFEKDSSNNQSVVFAFFGVFDGHGGTEAASLAHECLLDEIKSQDEFWSCDDDTVLQAIRKGYLRTHKRMVDERDRWPLTPSGFKSTAGTTASIAIIRNRKLYVGHVGDSAVVMGYCAAESKDATTDNWNGSALTVEHKPDHPEERRRIEAHGGAVRRKAGIHRVVWNRPKTSKPHAAATSTSPTIAEYEEIPFLAVARSLGDLWSFDPETQQFHVSPEPDITVYELRPGEDRCLIIGSDGLWNVMKPETAVELVRLCERETESRVFADLGVSPSFFYHPAGTLVQFALERCQQRNVRADNVTALVVMIDPPGKPMTQLRQERRRLLFSRLGMCDSGEEEQQRGVRQLLVESHSAVGRDACSSPTVSMKAAPTPDTAPILRSPRTKVLPVLSALRNTLQGPSGYPCLVEAWTDACWKEMLSYCRQKGLVGSLPFDPQLLLDHLMDMDAKYRKEALQAVPTVMSMKKAFAKDNEMTICLNQIPLLSREWTQLLVMSSSNPPSPTSPSSSLSPPILSPLRPPSPPACKRWLERREKILSHLCQMLGRRLPSELSKDAHECMKEHIAREVSLRMKISHPHDTTLKDKEERGLMIVREIEDGKKLKTPRKVIEDSNRKRRPTRGTEEVETPSGADAQDNWKRRLTRGTDESEKEKRHTRITEEAEKDKEKRPARGTEDTIRLSGLDLKEGRKRRLTNRVEEDEEVKNRRSTRGKDLQEDSGGRHKGSTVNGDLPVSSVKPVLRRVARQKSSARIRSQSENIPQRKSTSPEEPAPSLEASDGEVEESQENGVQTTPMVTPWSALPRKSRFPTNKPDDQQKAVEDLMDKLVVVVQPTADLIKSLSASASKPKEDEVSKPRPVILPALKKVKPAAAVQRKRKSESDAIPAKPPKFSEELMKSSTYKGFYQRIVIDEKAEAKLEEVMKSLTYTFSGFPSPTALSSRPFLIGSSSEADDSPSGAKRSRIEMEINDSPDSKTGRRSLRLRSNKST